FALGFYALVLAGSELFTENFLVPVMAAAAGRASLLDLARLWAGTALTNLLGGWIVMGLVVSAFPRLDDEAIETGRTYAELGLGWTALAAAILAGMVITLMTWMERRAENTVGKLVAATVAAFPLFVGPLIHTVVTAHEMFAALHVGAPFGYLDAGSAVGLAIVGNNVGGVGLVTALRLTQVGKGPILASRADR
ncbi:MAG TPA: formate/nitrite transporter family protein, partial [Acidimicrobiia bacterium]|nr:formate/nitrite transporter family protein [Acidimicrobiia bacterium]